MDHRCSGVQSSAIHIFYYFIIIVFLESECNDTTTIETIPGTIHTTVTDGKSMERPEGQHDVGIRWQLFSRTSQWNLVDGDSKTKIKPIGVHEW